MPSASLPSAGRQLGVFNVKDYGATGNGSTNDYTAVQAAITACGAAGGGTVHFPPGTYYCASQLTIPDDNTGTWPKLTGNVRLTGAMGWETGRSGDTPRPSAILDIRANTAPGMIYSRGIGRLEIDHLTFRNEGTSTQPFIYTTGTSVQVNNCGFSGKSTKSGTTCDQDAIVMGGTTITEDGSSSAPFQGYVSRVENNCFNRIRKAVLGRTYFNANLIAGNWVQHDCGSGTAGDAPFELLGHSTNSCQGNVFLANQVEAIYYTYGFKADYAIGNSWIGNSVYDMGGSFSATYRFGASGAYNMVIHGSGGATQLSEHASSASTNTFLSATQGVPWQFSQYGFRIGATGAALTANGTLSSKQRLYWDAHMELASLGVGNTSTASTLGVVVKKLPVYDQGGNIMGYAPLYNSIT